MNSFKNYLILFLALASLGGGVLAWQQHRQLAVLRAANEGDDRTALQKRLEAAEQRARDLAAQLASLAPKSNEETEAARADSPAENSEVSAAQAEPAPSGEERASRNASMRALLEKPEVQRLIALQEKTALDRRYADLFKTLNLPPEQLEQFKNLLVEKQTAMHDLLAAARAQGINPRTDPESFRKIVASAQADIDNNIRAVVGEAAYTQYRQYEQTLPQRNVVNQLQQSLSYTATPLSQTQAEQMVQILASSTPQHTSGTTLPRLDLSSNRGRHGFGGLGGGSATITADAIALAQGVLAPTQLQALRQLQQAQQAERQLRQQIQQIARESRPSAQSTAP